MLDVVGLLVQLVSGVAGAYLIVRLVAPFDLGRLGNLMTGMIGGAVGGQMIATVLDAGMHVPLPPGDASSMVALIAAGGICGGIAVVLVALLRRIGGGS